ncbi:MAG: bifunctional glutamate N-acetyltransferase/amino-acid acetyltransferase ArgJ [Dehalococcoidales bacterium]|nr:bifunctional glutamate N-acetyltransferase/amino-acid acetyltransferase ArgJ [Dehalococcoidales bacterium]
MKTKIISSGSVTSPKGFSAGATCAGIKKVNGSLDLGILASGVPCTAAALFTTNRIQAAPVILSRQRLQSGRASAIIVNSGCANACTGEQGLKDAEEMAELAAKKLGVPAESVLVASTGVIGQCLAMAKIRQGIKQITLARDGGHELEKAMMTTDRMPKEIAVSAGTYTIGGAAKGSGMIHPNLATMLCFLTTDASVDLGFLRQALRKAADISFNMVSVDGDTSTNDMVLLMASGLAGNKPIAAGSAEAGIFEQALNEVCVYLAKCIARDGEGATKLIEVTVSGAPGPAEARQVARTIVNSSLVKTAVYGNDPNWGRIVAAAGRSGVEVVEPKISLNIGGINILKNGRQLSFTREEVAGKFKQSEVKIALDLGLGNASATAWGCDLSEEYVKINSEYTT